MRTEVGYAEALSEKPRPGKKIAPKLDHMRITPAENGGHVVDHHFKSGPEMTYKEPEPHVFGKSEGKNLLSHISEHLGIKVESPDEVLAHPEQE